MSSALDPLKPIVINAPTRAGRMSLGRLVKTARVIDKQWSRKDLRDQLALNVLIVQPDDQSPPAPYIVKSDMIIKSLEEGASIRDFFLIDAIAALQFIAHPVERHRYWTAQELRFISYGLIDPATGEMISRSDSAASVDRFPLEPEIWLTA